MSEQREGWGWPMNSRKAHYFIEGRSLCGKWAYFGQTHENMNPKEDTCAACRRKEEARAGESTE